MIALKNKFIAITFVLILLIPALDSFFHFSPVKELFEKRVLVEMPEFSWSRQFSKNFEEFFNDNYGMRKSLIRLHSKIIDDIFAESPDESAVFGKEGWLYFNNKNSLVDAAGKIVLSDDLIERGIESFYQNWQMLKAKNITYLLVIAPDKSTIYPEFLPNYIRPEKSHRIDKFIDALKEAHPDFPLLDLRPALFEAKNYEIIFHKTDTHWNRRGAHYGYLELMNKLRIKPRQRVDFENKEDEIVRGDISDIMGIGATNVNYDLIPKFKIMSESIVSEDFDPYVRQFRHARLFVNENKNLPRLFVYRDSFFNDLSYFVSEHFSRSLYINEFPCDLNFAKIKNFHPDFVIQQFWEGRIEDILASCN